MRMHKHKHKHLFSVYYFLILYRLMHTHNRELTLDHGWIYDNSRSQRKNNHRHP